MLSSSRAMRAPWMPLSLTSLSTSESGGGSSIVLAEIMDGDLDRRRSGRSFVCGARAMSDQRDEREEQEGADGETEIVNGHT